MKTIRFHQLATLVLSLLFSATILAAPTSGPYITDPQNEYVQDATSDAIGTVNMVLCILNGMNISGSGMLNVGPYIALIDMNKCQSHGGSSGASTAVNYMTAIVDATRASDTAPMIANVWMSMTEQGNSQDIYVKLTATTPPSAALPYGVFRLDFLGKNVPGGVMQMNGFIDSATGSLQYYETGPNSSNVSLNMAAGTTASGNGVMTVGVSYNNPTPVTYNFNYDANNFRRSDTVHDQCFERAKLNAKRSVWRYGTYNDSDGTRVDQPNPSFQLTGIFGGSSYYGYASYYGIGFQGLDLNSTSVTNATNSTTGLVNGLVVTDQRPGHTTDTFSLSKVGGKLTKWTQNTTSLSAMDGIPFNFFGNLSAVTTPAVANNYQSWQLQWDNVNSRFTVLGTQSCGSTGCSLAPIATTVTTTAIDSMPISGWSDAFGGNINIPSAVTRTGSTVVSYFSQSTVTPGTTPLTLRCLNNCPDAASVAATVGYISGPQSPFGGTTASQWFSAPNLAATVLYSFDGTGLNNGGTAMIINTPSYFTSGTSYQYGVTTGRLFDASGSAVATDMIATCGAGVCEPSNPSVYYTWTTGANQWNQSMWLTRTNGTNSGTIVAFDPPQIMQYTVPTGSAYGSLSGKAIQLQFNGFGNLSGIPGNCVSPVDNSVVDCSTQNSRYVPAFSIPDTVNNTMSLNGTTIIVKALDAEIRLNDLGPGAAACSGMSLTTTLIPPDGTGALGIHDVSAAMGTYSVGNKPAFTAAPKVIDGVVQ